MILPNGMDVPVLAQQTFGQKVQQNAEIALKSGSTYVVIVAGVLGALYASMSTAQQTQLVEAWPILKGWTPVVGVLVTFVVAKLKPSDAVSAPTKALVDELARLRLNVYYRAHGLPELPLPAPTPLPVVPVIEPVIPAALAPRGVVTREEARALEKMPPMPPAPPPLPARAEPPPPTFADTQANTLAPAPPPEPPPVARVPWPFPSEGATAEDKAWQAAQAPTQPPGSPVEPVTRVDVKLPLNPPRPAAPPPLPIDARLLLSLVQEYLAQQAPGKPPATVDASTHL